MRPDACNGWAGINLDITRLKRTERALLEADRRKDEFLATLGARTAQSSGADPQRRAAFWSRTRRTRSQRKWGREVIARQVHRMALLLDDLLDVSRITRGQFELKKDYVELKAAGERRRRNRAAADRLQAASAPRDAAR